MSAYARPLYDPGGRHALVKTAQGIIPANLSSLIARYRTIQQPTLLIWCRQDRVVPVWVGRRLARALPNAQLSLLKGCGQCPARGRAGRNAGPHQDLSGGAPRGEPPRALRLRRRLPLRARRFSMAATATEVRRCSSMPTLPGGLPCTRPILPGRRRRSPAWNGACSIALAARSRAPPASCAMRPTAASPPHARWG